MDIFKEQLKIETKNQEIKANTRTIRGFFWVFLAVTFVWLFTMVGFFSVDKASITLGMIISAFMSLISYILYLKCDLSAVWLRYFFLALICILAAIINAFLTYHAAMLFVLPLLFSIQYRSRRALWFTFGFNILTMVPSCLIGFYYGLCDLNILFESTHTREWYLAVFTNGVMNIPLNQDPWVIILLYEVMPRTAILLLFTIMLQYGVISNTEDIYRIAKLTYSKDTDMSTRLYNKNKFEEMKKEYYPSVSRIAVIFWDLNNLKTINDRYGHAAGDELIAALSEKLILHNSDSCRIYRIGGDEFIMILDDPLEKEAEKTVELVRKELRHSRIRGKIDVSSAVGISYGLGREIENVVKEADMNMYQDKTRGKEEQKKNGKEPFLS